MRRRQRQAQGYRRAFAGSAVNAQFAAELLRALYSATSWVVISSCTSSLPASRQSL
jgi:hypothetical protein